jgi:hypothetical protein
VRYRVNPDNLDVTDAQALTAIRFGAQAWTDQTKAAFRFRYDGTSTSTTLGMNGQNLVLFRNAEGSSPTVRATAYTWKTGSTILETDIVFWDQSLHFIVGTMDCTDSIYIENTAIHEFGHALGLDHTSVTTATMYGHDPACATKNLDLDPDDIAGAEALYPCVAASECNDGRVCTADACRSSQCERTPIAGCCTAASQCNDGNACTTDACQANVCEHTPIAGCCTAASQCNDGDACTTDTCESHVCEHTPIAGCCSTPCDGGVRDAAADGSGDGADAAQPGGDAGLDAGGEAGLDGGPEAGGVAGPDGGPEAGGDAGLDGGPEAGGDAGLDGETLDAGPAGSAGGKVAGGCALAPDGRSGSIQWAWLAGWLALVRLVTRPRRRP